MKFYIFILLCGIATSAFAEDKMAYLDRRNEIRIGWGDQLFETLMWHKPLSVVQTMPATYEQVYHENFKYYQHLWIEYQWRFNHWFSLGGMFDGSGVSWDNVTRNGKGQEVARQSGEHFYNLVIMPTVRFTYYHHEYVNLFSGLGFGMDINGGTETNAKGWHTDVGAAVNITVFGVSANYDRWFATVEFGGLYALKNANTIFMASSRIINVSIGARF